MRSDDEKLVSQTLAGDRDAFGVLVHKYQEMVYAYAFQKVRNEEDAQDVTQEVFWRAYHHLYQLRHPHRFRSWLYTIMSNECKRRLVSVIKTRRRETALEDATDDVLRIEPAHTAPTEGWRVDLEQAISELADENRIAVLMFYMGDRSLKEISEFLGVSVNTVKGKLYRARQQLGNALSESYGSLLKSHKLKGGFLMQFMEQIRYMPSPTMASSWSATAIGKIVFSLILAVCVLIGIARHGTDSPMSQPINRIGVGPTEVVLLAPIAGATRSSIPVASTQTENLPPAGSSRASGDQGRQLASRRATPEGGGSAQPAAAAANESEKIIFSGRVVDSGGAPVAAAVLRYTVSFYPLEGDARSGYSSYYGPLFFTRTGADGTFRFELSPSRLKWMPFDSKDMLSRLNIAVKHPDHAIWWQEVPFQTTSDVEIQLETPEIISGKVMNEVGEPIQNAKILMQSVFRGDSRDHGDSLIHNALPQPVKTDANGEFVLPGLPQGATISLDVQGPGYAKEMRHSVPVSAKRLEFRLKREGRIEGRLTYAGTGTPVRRGAVVSFRGIYPTRGWGEARVNWRGNYRLKNVAPGTYSLGLNHGSEGWTVLAKEFITVAEGQTVNVDLTLIRSGFITGRVTDQDTNEPIANHPIRLNDAARPEDSSLIDHHAITDETGAYRFDAAPGQALVYTNPPGGYRDIRQIGRSDIGQIQRRVDVVEGETVVVDFQFSRGVKLAGRVLTETGEPVAGARISNTRDWHEAYSISDKLGRFTVAGLRSGQILGLKAEHSRLRLHGMAEVEVQPGVPIEIRMKSYGQVKVSGRVIDHEGKPMPSMDVLLMRWDPQRYLSRGTTVAVTDDDGWFREIELIVGDEYTISVELEGYRRTETEKFTAMAEMAQIADLVLLPAGGEFFIEGRVTDTSGEPVQGIRLGIGQQSQNWSTHTDENGDYRLEDLSMAVIFTLYMEDPRYANHEFKILKTNQWHDLVLIKADAYLAGKVVDTDGKPIEGAWVMVRGEEDSFSSYQYPSTHTNVHGEFELTRIKDPIVSVDVIHDRNYKIFENIAVNQRDLVFTLTPADARPEPTPEQQAERETRRSYVKGAEERVKTLVNQPAPELSVAEWLSGSPTSIEDLKGKTIALYFWTLNNINHVRQIRLLNILQEVYRDKGLVCVAICPATAVVDTLKGHIAAESLSYSIGLDQSIDVVGAEGETFDRYAMGWGGEIVLINRAGEITGSTWDHDYEDKIQALLVD